MNPIEMAFSKFKALLRHEPARTVDGLVECRKVAIPHDAIVYSLRNRIERCFGRLKHFRRFASRYDRRTIHFPGFVHLAAAMAWLR